MYFRKSTRILTLKNFRIYNGFSSFLSRSFWSSGVALSSFWVGVTGRVRGSIHNLIVPGRGHMSLQLPRIICFVITWITGISKFTPFQFVKFRVPPSVPKSFFIFLSSFPKLLDVINVFYLDFFYKHKIHIRVHMLYLQIFVYLVPNTFQYCFSSAKRLKNLLVWRLFVVKGVPAHAPEFHSISMYLARVWCFHFLRPPGSGSTLPEHVDRLLSPDGGSVGGGNAVGLFTGLTSVSSELWLKIKKNK